MNKNMILVATGYLNDDVDLKLDARKTLVLNLIDTKAVGLKRGTKVKIYYEIVDKKKT